MLIEMTLTELFKKAELFELLPHKGRYAVLLGTRTEMVQIRLMELLRELELEPEDFALHDTSDKGHISLESALLLSQLGKPVRVMALAPDNGMGRAFLVAGTLSPPAGADLSVTRH